MNLKHTKVQFTSSFRSKLILSSFLGIVFIIRIIIPERPLDYMGLRAILDIFFTLSLSIIFLLTSFGIGEKIFGKFINNDQLSKFERSLFTIPLGMGTIAYGILGLALLHILNTVAIFLWMWILFIWSSQEIVEVTTRIHQAISSLGPKLAKLPIEQKGLAGVGLLIMILTILQTLTPPWDADGLIYHLRVPMIWLKNNTLVRLPGFWEANYPMTVELIYTLGLAFGSDSFSKLLHLVFAVIMLAGTYGFTRRFSKSDFAWIAPTILLGIPIIPLWASSSYSDMGWVVFEFLSIFALILWHQSGDRNYLILGGLFIGWGMGSKYPALAAFGVYFAWIVWQSRSTGIKQMFMNCALFGLAAILVCSPWYLKNWFWFQNPVYPLPIGDLFASARKDNLWMAYMLDGFGTGNKIQDLILIPWNLFASRDRFSTFAGNIEIPSPLFLLAFLFPFITKTQVMSNLAFLALLRYLLWMSGVQQTRLLLPLFPVLSILAGEVLISLAKKRRLAYIGRVIIFGLIGGMLTATLIYTVLLFLKTRPLGILIGYETKSQFLSRLVDNYPATSFIQNTLSPDTRVMMMWDGRGYYCDDRCMPDSDHTQWTEIIRSHPNVSAVAHELRRAGVTHLMLSGSDADFILQHDPTGDHMKAIQFFLDEFSTSCTKLIYQDEWASVYELTCPSNY